MIGYEKFMAFDYGPIKKNAPLNIINVGYDWYGVRYQGKYIYVPINFTINSPIVERENRRDEQ